MTSRLPHTTSVASPPGLDVPVELAHDCGKSSRDDVRRKLLDAALEILLCQGIQAFTQARVAERAGVRQSHLTYYFPTRSHLLTAVVERGSQVVLDTMGASSVSLPPTLADFRQAMANHLGDTRMPRLMIALMVASDEDPTLKIWMTEFDLRMQERMRLALLRYGLNVGASELALFHATVVGISILSVRAPVEQFSKQAGQMFVMAFDQLIRESVPCLTQAVEGQVNARQVKSASRAKAAITNEGGS